jgi:hypothetical protein
VSKIERSLFCFFVIYLFAYLCRERVSATFNLKPVQQKRIHTHAKLQQIGCCVLCLMGKWKSLICALSLGVVLMHAVNSAGLERAEQQNARQMR